MKVEDVVQRLEKMSNPEIVEGMKKFGITPKRAYGISIPDLRKLTREIGEKPPSRPGALRYRYERSQNTRYPDR